MKKYFHLYTKLSDKEPELETSYAVKYTLDGKEFFDNATYREFMGQKSWIFSACFIGGELPEVTHYLDLSELHKFTNGFDNWYETHHLIVESLSLTMMSDEDCWPKKLLEIHNSGGIAAMFSLAKELTDEFESKFEGVFWDGNWFDAVELFISEKYKEWNS